MSVVAISIRVGRALIVMVFEVGRRGAACRGVVAICVGLSVGVLGVERRGDLNARGAAPDRAVLGVILAGTFTKIHQGFWLTAHPESSRASRATDSS